MILYCSADASVLYTTETGKKGWRNEIWSPLKKLLSESLQNWEWDSLSFPKYKFIYIYIETKLHFTTNTPDS